MQRFTYGSILNLQLILTETYSIVGEDDLLLMYSVSLPIENINRILQNSLPVNLRQVTIFTIYQTSLIIKIPITHNGSTERPN